MRFFWRSDNDELTTHAAWVGKLDPKNRQPGTSAPTLANAWSGPLDLLGALATHASFQGVAISSATVEERAAFDEHGGNVRNHDVVVRGTNAAGDRVVVCVEAKAGETLGATVAEQKVATKKALTENPKSKAAERLDGLVTRFCRHPIDHPEVAALRYQLLTAWAGTLASAAGAQHAVSPCTSSAPTNAPRTSRGSTLTSLAASPAPCWVASYPGRPAFRGVCKCRTSPGSTLRSTSRTS